MSKWWWAYFKSFKFYQISIIVLVFKFWLLHNHLIEYSSSSTYEFSDLRNFFLEHEKFLILQKYSSKCVWNGMRNIIFGKSLLIVYNWHQYLVLSIISAIYILLDPKIRAKIPFFYHFSTYELFDLRTNFWSQKVRKSRNYCTNQ